MRKSRDYKNLAKQKMFYKYGTLAGATAVYGAIYVGIVMAIMFAMSANLISKGVFESIESMQNYVDVMSSSTSYFFISEGVTLLVGAIMSVFAVGVKYIALNVARGKETKISDVFFAIKNNPDKVVVIFLIQNIIMIIAGLPANMIALSLNKMTVAGAYTGNGTLEIIYFAFKVLSYIVDIAVIAYISQAEFIFLDEPMLSSIDCIRASLNVMKKNLNRYINLFISFIPLYFLAIFTMGIGFIWVIPYQYTSYALFYMQLKGEIGSTVDVTIQ